LKLQSRASEALAELERVILDYLKTRPTGAINNEIAKELGLESDFDGRQRNYLTYSLLGGLVRRGLVVRKSDGARKAFHLVSNKSLPD
jgi:hypothetical protein